MAKILAVIFACSILIGFASAQPVTHAKWGKHKKAQPFVVPDAPFPIDELDPRTDAVHDYLDKKMVSLQEDLEKYPNLQVQLNSLIDDVNELRAMPVSDPDFAEKFSTMHTTLLWVWGMETNDAT